MKTKLLILSTIFLGSSSSLFAATSALEFKFKKNLDNNQYKELVSPLLSPIRFKWVDSTLSANSIPLMPAFETGVIGSFSPMPEDVKNLADEYLEGQKDDIPNYLALPTYSAQVTGGGLVIPVICDLGVALNLAMVPGSDIKLLGFSGQYNVELPFPIAQIALGARAGYTSLTGLENYLTSTSMNIEALASVGVNIPVVGGASGWAGFGMANYTAQSQYKKDIIEINAETEWKETYMLIGAKASLAIIRLAAELQQPLGDKGNPIYSVRVGIGL